jgi:DNA polymerase/3'-5' exonuclease PolX
VSIQRLAQDLLENLSAGCERIEIAGSIRRGKANPKDIELVCIPKPGKPLLNLFGEPTGEAVSLFDSCLEAVFLTPALGWIFDAELPRNGPRYKRLRHMPSGVCCDLFLTTTESWGVIFAIRTGDAEFSKELVTRALRRGMKVDEGRLWKVHRDGTRDVIPTPDETAYFAALGLPYIEPAERTLAAWQLAAHRGPA